MLVQLLKPQLIQLLGTFLELSNAQWQTNTGVNIHILYYSRIKLFSNHFIVF